MTLLELDGEKMGDRELYSFTASNEAFLGMTSSMKGSRPGYVSSSFWRRPRCTEDLTLDRLLGGILDETQILAGVFGKHWWLELSHRSHLCLDMDCGTAAAVFAVPQAEEDVCSHLTSRMFRTSYWPSCGIAVSGLKGLTHSFLNMMLVEVVII